MEVSFAGKIIYFYGPSFSMAMLVITRGIGLINDGYLKKLMFSVERITVLVMTFEAIIVPGWNVHLATLLPMIHLDLAKNKSKLNRSINIWLFMFSCCHFIQIIQHLSFLRIRWGARLCASPPLYCLVPKPPAFGTTWTRNSPNSKAPEAPGGGALPTWPEVTGGGFQRWCRMDSMDLHGSEWFIDDLLIEYSPVI